LAAAKRAGAHEALMPNIAGQLCEGTGSNVVLVLDGQLVTPPLSSGCLAGITRELLLEWAGQDGLAILEDDVPLSALAEADDVLLLSSTRDVQRVAVADGKTMPGHELGSRAIALFAARAGADVDP
jgi:branched-chain amino acid aminotransferase